MKKLLFIILVSAFMSVFFIGSARAESPVSISLFNPIQIVNEYDSVKGLRFNLIYGVNDDVAGIDFGLVNKSYGTQKGFQLGMFNNTTNFRGLQIGLINNTHQFEGVQVGLINMHYKNTKKSFTPFINWNF